MSRLALHHLTEKARPLAVGLFRSLAPAGLSVAVACGPSEERTSAGAASLPLATPAADSRTFDVLPEFLAGYWRRPIPAQGPPPEGLSPLENSLEPSACGTCHVQQYEDWRTTIHAAAFSPGFAGQLVSQEETNFAFVASCLVCHAPLSEQSERLLLPGGGFGLNPGYDPALRDQGLVCAACHVRGWKRYGPPRRGGGLDPSPPGSPHGGVNRTTFFEDARFCMGCHQFEVGAPAPNGKPLENTYVEWRESRYGLQGVICQSCHMPDRRHVWRGIHDPQMVRSGLTIDWVGPYEAGAAGRELALRVTNSGTGHRFPTYVTPEVVVRVELLDGAGRPIDGATAESTIARRVALQGGTWVEFSDTRLPPDSSLAVRISLSNPEATLAHGTVEVRPDAFYEGEFRKLLAGSLTDSARVLIRAAHRRSLESPFAIFDDTLVLGR
ncbi:MAG: multiheme c-type cytochrome [Gemmatimonadota bacterium]